MKPKINNTLKIPFTTRATATVFHTTHSWEDRSVGFLSIVACLLFVAYLSLVGASITHVMDRTAAEERYAHIKGNLSVLEAEHYELSRQVTIARAAEYGLVPLAHTTYIAVPGTAVVLGSERSNEI